MEPSQGGGGGGALNTLVYGDVSPRNLQDPKKYQEKFSVTQKYL